MHVCIKAFNGFEETKIIINIGKKKGCKTIGSGCIHQVIDALEKLHLAIASCEHP